MEKYVCAFRGRRDDYQIPLSLAEHNRLDQFITDFYTKNNVQKVLKTVLPTLKEKIDFRCKAGLSDSQVRSLIGTTLVERFRHRVGLSKAKTFAKFDRIYSEAACARARKTHSYLFLYSPYALEAFRASYRHEPRKVLFQFHPHHHYESRILAEDVERFPLVQDSYHEEVGTHIATELTDRVNNAWKYADLIFCASSFTQRTLLEVGADPAKCRVVPYGIDLPSVPISYMPSNQFTALFVGSGIQRKGLHHLLLSWQRANLPQDSLLILVCRNLDPGIETLAQSIPTVKILYGINEPALAKLYATSSLFVMPSLVEGFGQVFLEALSYGCPVLGTSNTCLPDLGGEADGIFLTEPADLAQLAYWLEKLAMSLPENLEIRKKARTCAAKFSWQQFRLAVRSEL